MFLTKSLLHTTDVYIKKLKEAGIETVWDFLTYFPRDIEDKSEMIEEFSLLNIKEKQVIKCKIEILTSEMTRNKKLLTKAVLVDRVGSYAEAVWFNRWFLMKNFSQWDTVIIYGQPKYEYGKLSFSSAEIEKPSMKRREIVPVYSDVNYISGSWIREKISLLKMYISDIPDEIPELIRKQKNFRLRFENIEAIHFPNSMEDFERAKSELGYEELFHFQKRWLEKKYELEKSSLGLAPAIPLDSELMKELIASLPFPLTSKQKIVLFQILKDMERPHAMARMLQWDVGTGKTVVALLASMHAILVTRKRSNNIQVAIMAPTEILARQHFNGQEGWLSKWGITSDLLVGSLTPRMKEEARSRLKNGTTDIIFGTHALIQDSVAFKNLGFVVVDEQHRFGVEQRKALEEYCSEERRNVYSYTSKILDKDFNYIKKIIDDNVFNTLNIQKKDYSVIKHKDEIIGFGRIWKLETGEYELSNLWIDEKYRGKKLGYYLIKFLLKEKLNDGDLFLTCNYELKGYYEKIWFYIVDIFPDRFKRTLEWAKEKDIQYCVMKTENSKLTSYMFNISSKMIPHRLNMSATPIPRSLVLTLYGDQDISVLDEYPAWRKPIHTKVVKEERRIEIYRIIEEEVKSGRQVYWISPLVEESETLDIASATNMRDVLSWVFPTFTVGLIHGKMSGKDKDRIMQEFYENKIHILSSTSVVEVWVNNPNATIMCIEASERFGLSQLHQFRGRVGRGEHQSYCYLFTTKEYKTDRLKAMEQTNDGFELSQIDLDLRGPGEVYWVRQSGIPDFHFADLRDVDLISEIRADIEEWMKWKKVL